MKTGFLSEYLNKRKQDHQHRQLRPIAANSGIEITCQGSTLVNFSSNNYLGLADHSIIRQRAIDFIGLYGCGATASRLVCGNHLYHENAEAKLATLMQSEAALLFSSGYVANLTLLPALADRHSLILADKHNHNSLLQGALASNAKVIRYRHNDLQHLQELLSNAAQENYARTWIVTESIFSMDGDATDINALVHLSNKYDALLYIDDAHGTAIAGLNGMGLTAGNQNIDIALGAFGKGCGAAGAFVACSQLMRDYLIQACSGVIYSTAIPPAIVGAIDGALEIIPSLTEARRQLHENAAFLRQELPKLGFDIGCCTTHIIPIMIGSDERVMSLMQHLEQKGLLAVAIRPPTVAPGSARLRVSLSALHTKKHLQQLLDALQGWSG